MWFCGGFKLFYLRVEQPLPQYSKNVLYPKLMLSNNTQLFENEMFVFDIAVSKLLYFSKNLFIYLIRVFFFYALSIWWGGGLKERE